MVLRKNPSFRAVFTKNQYRDGDCLKGGGGGELGQFVDLNGWLGKKEGG